MTGAVSVILMLCLWQAFTNKDDKKKGRYGWLSIALIWWLFVLTGALKFWSVNA